MKLKRNCDNCNFGSYGLDCSEDGKEILYCKESTYEIEVDPSHVCEDHIFIEGYQYANKKFLKRLTEEQLKILILLVINAYENEQKYQSYSNYYQCLAHVKLICTKEYEWDDIDKVYIGTKIGSKKGYYSPWFMVDDTEIEMHDGNFKKQYNEVLQQYLSQIFGNEYIEFLYQLKLTELNEEKENLINISEGPSLVKVLPKLNDKKMANNK